MTNRIPTKIAFSMRKGLCRYLMEESMDYARTEFLAKDNAISSSQSLILNSLHDAKFLCEKRRRYRQKIYSRHCKNGHRRKQRQHFHSHSAPSRAENRSNPIAS